MLPRVDWATHLKSGFWEIELTDWKDAKFPTKTKVLWYELDGVYCLAETSKSLDEYTQLLFPGIATTCFEEMSYAEMKGR